MRLDGFGLLVEDMRRMVRFYRDVLRLVHGTNPTRRKMRNDTLVVPGDGVMGPLYAGIKT